MTKLNEIQEDSGNWILEGYEAAIDFGAHPNTRSVMGHLSFKHEDDGGAAVTLTGLYGPTAWETERTLLACLEYGLSIAIVLARCLDAPSADVEGSLFQLSADKEALVANLKGA